MVNDRHIVSFVIENRRGHCDVTDTEDIAAKIEISAKKYLIVTHLKH